MAPPPARSRSCLHSVRVGLHHTFGGDSFSGRPPPWRGAGLPRSASRPCRRLPQKQCHRLAAQEGPRKRLHHAAAARDCASSGAGVRSLRACVRSSAKEGLSRPRRGEGLRRARCRAKRSALLIGNRSPHAAREEPEPARGGRRCRARQQWWSRKIEVHRERPRPRRNRRGGEARGVTKARRTSGSASGERQARIATICGPCGA